MDTSLLSNYEQSLSIRERDAGDITQDLFGNLLREFLDSISEATKCEWFAQNQTQKVSKYLSYRTGLQIGTSRTRRRGAATRRREVMRGHGVAIVTRTTAIKL